MNIVISQPFFLPWIGLFEQFRLADIYVHCDDCQLPEGRSFIRKIQLKTPQGQMWLTVPLIKKRSRCQINEVRIDESKEWKYQHLEALRHSYSRAPYFKIMFDLAKTIYDFPGNNLGDFNQNATEIIAEWLGLRRRVLCSSGLGVSTHSSRRVLDICLQLGAKRYISGHGALNYLDHSLFEEKNIEVCYMRYNKTPYPQLYGEFTPFVTVLDAIANCGKEASSLLTSDAIYWKDFINEI
jgi:hypothetical protein